MKFAPLMMLAALSVVAPSRGADESHTFDGRWSITAIDLTVVYIHPKDRDPLSDWRDRVDYYMKRIARFHERESGGRSKLRIDVRPEPLRIDRTAEDLRGKDANDTFFRSTGDAAKALGWPKQPRGDGYPILLVLSEINWRELDDFTRTRIVDGKPVHEGNLGRGGRHFPGAESGGARATYDRRRGVGMGLVSADGWRVPYSGSDCVVYHEGLGHTIGLPHPEPIDDSVMGLGQYNFWINESWINAKQKTKLGWPSDDVVRKPDRSGTTDLFTAFTALQSPIKPKPDAEVLLRLTWPKDAKAKAIRVRVQTEIRGAWRDVEVDAKSTPKTVSLGKFPKPTPVSYRVDATLEDGQTAEIWGYFQVK